MFLRMPMVLSSTFALLILTEANVGAAPPHRGGVFSRPSAPVRSGFSGSSGFARSSAPRVGTRSFVPTPIRPSIHTSFGPYRPISPASFFANPAGFGVSRSPYNHYLHHYEHELLRAELATAALANGYNPYLYNPYLASSYGYANPYTYGGYSGSYSGAGATYAATPSYAAPAASSYAAPAGDVIPVYNPSAAQAKQPSVLAAFGIPFEFGEVQWPIAFRLMPPNLQRDLLDQLESQLKIVASQALAGNVSPVLLRETKNTIDHVKLWLRDRQPYMAEVTYQEADAFLQRLENFLRKWDA